ncbi:ABC transporter substrate-binding protein [Patulibacter sp. SYSU D01012]|uniref:ABC transporter substrate-binding protein n=1 Tax=Patulibacter sp. SYSU D01012 TaxID=2817381 RepID=UPI001B3020B7|nr:ABC transporter substrate-binding protein [Patulibacter sp. SYSU D01012]
MHSNLKRTLRRLLTALTAIAVVAVVAGCGGSSVSGSNASDAPEGKKGPFTIGYDVYWLGNSWSVQLYQEFKASAERNKGDITKVVYTQSDNQVQKQISNIQSMISRKVDAIIMTPISPSATVPVIKQAEAAGIPVILLSAEADTKDYTALVTVDQKKFGAAGAEWLAKKLNGKGSIYALNGVAGLSTDTLRFDGAKEVFKKYPGIKIVADAHAAWDEAQAKRAVSNMLSSHPDVDGVWSQGGAMTLGAIQAFQAARHKLVPMVGENNNGLMKEWVDLQDKGFDSVGVTNPTWLADDALKTTLKALKGEEFQKDNVLAPPTITDADLKEFVRTDLPDSFWVNTRLSEAQITSMFKN